MKDRKERKFEKICRECFNKHLSKKLSIKDIKWKINNDDPPDYFYTINDKDYAVEATSIDDRIKVGLKKLPFLSLFNSQFRLIKEVQKELEDKGVGSGTYHVSSSGTHPKYKSFENSIKESIIKFILDNKSVDSTDPIRIFQKNELIYFIIKDNNSKPLKINPGYIYEKNKEKAKNEFFALLQQIINEALQKISKNSNLPKILLLLNTSFIVEEEDYKDFVYKLEFLEEFQIIFMCKSEEEGYFIYNILF